MRKIIRVMFISTALIGASVSSCFEGGANFNQQGPGNNDSGGVDLGGKSTLDSWESGEASHYGAVAVDPTGSYFLSRVGTMLVHGDLATGKVTVIPAITSPSRVAFGHNQNRFYISSEDYVFAMDGATRTVAWQVYTKQLGPGPKIYASKDDRWLVVAGPSTVDVLDATTGKLAAQVSPGQIQDVDITPDSKTAIVTLDHAWTTSGPETRLVLVELASGSYSQIVVPNCSSPLVLTPDGSRAFLAPTTCSKDPVSVIDLKAKKWLKNLPGFGPVAMATDGVTAIAFMDAENLDLTLFGDSKDIPSKGTRYHMMLLDTRTLKFSSVPLGSELPRYTLTPDGKVVLLDAGNYWNDPGIRVLDVKTLKIHKVTGQAVKLDHFAVSPSSTDVYMIYQAGLYWLSVTKRKVEVLQTTFTCSALNITPDGELLLLLDDEGTIHIYDLATDLILHTMKPPAS